MNHLLPLLVALPVLGALVPFGLGRRFPALSRRATAVVLLGQVGLAVAVVAGVAANGSLTYVVGGLPAAVGIGLLADQVSSLFVLFVAVAAATLYVTVRTDPTGSTDALWLLFVAGLTGIAVTADVFNLYVFLEIAGLAAYALVASRRGPTAALAALHYLLVGTVGATFYLLGVGYLYVATGTLAMADLGPALARVGYDSPLVGAAFLLVVLGLGVKLALFPLHTWKPDAYAAAETDVAALLATLGSTIPGYALVRLTFDVFTVEFLATVSLVRTGLLIAGVVSTVVGGYLTLRQSNVRRLLSYSSVLQFGLIVVGIGLATPAAVTAVIVLLVANGIAKGGLFVAAGVFEREFGAYTVAEYAGRARDRPVLAAAVAIAFTSLVGLPPTVGFAGKWYLAVAAVAVGEWIVAAVVLLSTLLSLTYAARVVEQLYLSPAPADETVAADGGAGATRPVSAVAVAVVVLSAVATVVLGLGSTAFAEWIAPVVEGWV
ncbi:monovalent cation/H+ antiporter subunit D family protein [Halobellus sp. Atlit-31R]|nr:monovalent cation/H+ antiporter subunit D family protein [Halobellus sp. Atlit-31R]